MLGSHALRSSAVGARVRPPLRVRLVDARVRLAHRAGFASGEKLAGRRRATVLHRHHRPGRSPRPASDVPVPHALPASTQLLAIGASIHAGR
jgi:hypothetical protein